MFKLNNFIKSFRYALHGLKVVFKEEQSFRVQVFIAILVFCLAFYFQIRIIEAVILVLIVASVLALEILNSILERLVDALKPRIHPYVKVIKDMMAAVVLLVSVTAAIVGVLIFGAYI